MQKLVDILIPTFFFARYSSFQVCLVMKASKHKLYKLPILDIFATTKYWFATTTKRVYYYITFSLLKSC